MSNSHFLLSFAARARQDIATELHEEVSRELNNSVTGTVVLNGRIYENRNVSQTSKVGPSKVIQIARTDYSDDYDDPERVQDANRNSHGADWTFTATVAQRLMAASKIKAQRSRAIQQIAIEKLMVLLEKRALHKAIFCLKINAYNGLVPVAHMHARRIQPSGPLKVLHSHSMPIFNVGSAATDSMDSPFAVKKHVSLNNPNASDSFVSDSHISNCVAKPKDKGLALGLELGLQLGPGASDILGVEGSLPSLRDWDKNWGSNRGVQSLKLRQQELADQRRQVNTSLLVVTVLLLLLPALF